MIANRRYFHSTPELSFQEVKTAATVASHLRSYGLTEVWEQVGRTGVVAMIRGGAGAGPCIGLRADMDGLPVMETADVPYKSVNVGVMVSHRRRTHVSPRPYLDVCLTAPPPLQQHACGHDAHMAGLLAAARVLFAARSRLRGSVKLIFQPAEEGYGGAREMIKDGVLEEGRLGPRVDMIYGLHVWSLNPVGVVACSVGPVMAASDKFEITVSGSGGHGAAPHKSVDAIVGAAQVVSALQTIVSRSLDPLEAGVVTV